MLRAIDWWLDGSFDFFFFIRHSTMMKIKLGMCQMDESYFCRLRNALTIILLSMLSNAIVLVFIWFNKRKKNTIANHSECGRFPPCRITMDTTRCDHQRKQAELSRREQPHPTSRSRRTTATRHRGLFGSSLAMGVLSICTTENDPVKYNLNVCHVIMEFLYPSIEQILHSKPLLLRSVYYDSFKERKKKTSFVYSFILSGY